MNTEKIELRMTALEADSVAYVIMSALGRVTMLDRERVDATAAANELFRQLGYGHHTTLHGERVEDKVKVKS
jgi:hypothetical protein